MSAPEVIVLQYHTVETDTGPLLVAEAIDGKTTMPVTQLSLPMMAGWLRRQGYRWRFGSSGIWERTA